MRPSTIFGSPRNIFTLQLVADQVCWLPVALEAMQAQLSLLNTTQDASEGVTAFLQKRPPTWSGR